MFAAALTKNIFLRYKHIQNYKKDEYHKRKMVTEEEKDIFNGQKINTTVTVLNSKIF